MTNGNTSGGNLLVTIISFIIATGIVLLLHKLIFPSRPSLISIFTSGSILPLIVVLAVVLLLLGGLTFAIGRGEDKEGLFNKFRKRLTTRAANELKTRTQKYMGQVGVVTRWDIPEGREPKSFVENRLLLQVLLDYSLRLDIYNAKRFLFEKVKTEKVTQLYQSLGRYLDRKRLREEIASYRSTEPGSRLLTGPQFAPIGWAHFDRIILQHMQEIMEDAYDAIKLVNNPPPNANLNDVITDVANRIKNKNSTFIKLAESFDVAYINFEGRYEPYGTWHHIRSLMLNIYDMYNVFGVYEHDYIFPRDGAKFRYNPYYAPRDQADIDALPDSPHTVNLVNVDQNPSDSDVEVNRFGYDVRRINNSITNTLPNRPRKLFDPRRQSDFHLNLIYIMQFLGNEWRAFATDFRYGTYTPNSRVVKDYTDAMTRNIDVHLNDDAVEFQRQGGIAFDRRALGNSGLWKYWGRRHWYGDTNDVVMDNPYPRLTVLGVQSYLYELIKARERDPEMVINEFLNSYPLDLEKEIQTKEDIVQAIGKFREKKAA